ncbi:MAG: hypothetical protein WEB00_04270 [Dehalococcoidia bacterium]
MPDKPPVLQFSFPCDGAREDTGGAISIDRIVDGFHVRRPDDKNPLSFIQVLVVNGWTDGEGIHEDRVTVTGPDGGPVAESRDHGYRLNSHLQRAINMHGLGLQIAVEGEYRIHVFGDGREVLSYPVAIAFREGQRT